MSGKQATYLIRFGGRPAGDPSKYDFSEIQALLDATNPAKVSAAGYAYNTAARIMAEVAHELYLVGKNLAVKWEGADATAAQQVLGQLYATANELYWRSQQAGGALQTYGAVLPQYKGLKWPAGGASPVEDTARQQAAEKVMQAVNQHIGNAWDSMPEKVQTNLPNLGGEHAGQPYPSAPIRVTGGGSPGPGGVGGGGHPSGHVRLPHSPHSGGANPPETSAGGHGADLAGLPQAGGPLTSPPSPTGPAFSPGGASGMPNPTGGGFPPNGGLTPSFPGGGLGPGAVRGGGVGPSGLPEEEALSPMRRSMDPATGGGVAEQAEVAQARFGPTGTGGGIGAAGLGETERSRSTWLAEDAEIWTAGEEAAPAVLGGSPAFGGASHEETGRERTVWRDEEREIWTGSEIVPHGTIGAAPETIGATPEASETIGDAHEVESDILDVEQLQELLDSLEGDEETPTGGPAGRTQFLDLFEDLDVAEANEIGRRLNG